MRERAPRKHIQRAERGHSQHKYAHVYHQSQRYAEYCPAGYNFQKVQKVHIFPGLKIHLHRGLHFVDTINAVPLYYSWHGTIYDSYYNDKTLTLSMNMRASSNFFSQFSHSKTAISFNILLVPLILCLRNIYIFRSQITSACILDNKCSFLYYYMYKRQYTDKNTNIVKIYVYGSERA